MRPRKCLLVLTVILALCGCKDKSVGSSADILHTLVWRDDIAAMETAIANGADVNARNHRGWTALHWAAQIGRVRAVKLLIAKGAFVDELDRNGHTPLLMAMRHGEQSVVQLLLDRGANPDYGGTYNQTPTELAMQLNQQETARSLVAAGAEMTIHLAAYIGDLEKTKTLLDGGVAVDTQDNDRLTPLYWAAKSGHEDMVAILIARGADVNAGTGHILHTAVWNRHKSVVGLLCAHGANPNPMNVMNQTPLAEVLHAALDGSPRDESEPVQYRQLVETLLAHGAEVNPEAGGNELLLDFAIRFDLKELVENVLAKGNVDVNARGLLTTAIRRERDDIAELLLAYGARPTLSAFHLVAGQNDVKLAELLLAHGAEINAQDYDGDTALHIATRAGRREMVEFLIAHGAGLNVADAKGNTPLHYAAREHKEITELLLAKSAPVNTKNNSGDTPLHNAALRGNREIVELLLARGADATTKDNDGNSAYDEAVRRGHKDIAGLLYGQAAKQAAAKPASRGTTTRR
jgi:ankyrin repeat protein